MGISATNEELCPVFTGFEVNQRAANHLRAADDLNLFSWLPRPCLRHRFHCPTLRLRNRTEFKTNTIIIVAFFHLNGSRHMRRRLDKHGYTASKKDMCVRPLRCENVSTTTTIS